MMEQPLTQLEDFLRREGETRRILGAARPAAYQHWSYENIENAATRFASAAIASHEELKAIITDYYAYVSQRWERKSRKQRKSLLLRVHPNMPTHACEDLKLLRSRRTRKLTDQQKNILLCSQINLEQLGDDESLLMWMFARARHAPHHFVRSDLIRTNALENATDLMIFQPGGPQSYGGRLMHVNLTDKPELYGVAVQYYGATYQEMFARDDMMVCGLGMRVFEAQAMINNFLLKMCRAILHDQPMLQPQTLNPPSFSPIGGPEVPTILANVLRRPYMSATGSGFKDLATIVANRYETLADHAWSLREDPNCFVDWVNNIKVNTYVGDLKGGKGIEQVFPELIHSRFEALFTNLLAWTALRDAMTRLEQTIQRHNDKLEDGTTLFHDVALEFIRLSSIVVPYLKISTMVTTITYFSSAQNQKNYIFGDVREVQVMPRPGQHLSDEAKHIEWLMFALKDGKADYWGYDGFVVEIGKYLNSKNPAARELHSPITSQGLIDLAILISLRTELDRYTHMLPQAFSSYSAYMEANNSIRKEELFEHCMVQMPFREDLMAICNPKSGKFRYPAQKTRTKANVATMRAAEERLRKIWFVVIYDMKETKMLPIELAKFFISRKLSSTPEWVEPQCSSALPLHDSQKLADSPQSSIRAQTTDTGSKRNFEAPVVKTKEKTKGIVSTNEAEYDAQAQISEPTVAKPDPVFHVDKRALKVFRVLFYTPCAHAQPGEISWKDFLHAMTSIGFSAAHLFGSIWQFSSDEYGSIQFHDPHTAKMSFNYARYIGRRLARKFRWDGDNFQLK
jgi:hypothetical protein